MSDALHDVVGIGNAIVDVLALVDDEVLEKEAMNKGAMTIIDTETADHLYRIMETDVEISGGSAANTIAGLASVGGRGAFIGKVADDQLGEIFARDIRAAGVDFESAPLIGGAPTARALIFVTPDAERTMQTYLGACVELGPEDVDEKLIAGASVTYLEGYLWDPERAKEAFIKAAKIAAGAGRKVSLSLSDPFCVDRHRDEFVDLVENHVDILFGNEEEIKSLYQVSTFDDALQQVRGHCEIAALTRSGKGSVIVSGDDVHVVDAEQVVKVIDSTGAGDAYSAGFLYGYTQGKDLATCAKLGGILASEIITHYGARSEADLKALVAGALT